MAHSTGRGVARAGARGVAVGTAAIAVLGVLQQAIGAFNPRPSMSATIVAAVAFAGFVTKRLADRRREDREAAELRRLLAVWPPRPLRDVDPVHLGAFPARRDLGAGPPYVPRALDGDLHGALQPGSVVLVHGPHLAGKTRTAIEVARAALGDAHVIAPRTPDGLAELLALDARIDAGGPGRVVWLDDLGRFAAMLDPATLDEIRALGARAVAAVARSFELPSRLTPGERAAAHKLYPGVAFGDGIGPALAGTGTEATAPPPAPAPALDAPRPHPLRDLQLAVPSALTIAALTAAGLIWALAGFSTPTPPPIADQFARITRQAAREGRVVTRPAGVGALDLHGTRPGRTSACSRTGPAAGVLPRADELRVYDVRDGYLRPRLRFEPREPGARFEFRMAADIDFDGAVEIVGGYSRPDARQALVPFAIDFGSSATSWCRSASANRSSPRLAWSAGSGSRRASTARCTPSRSRSRAARQHDPDRAASAGLHRDHAKPAPRRRLLRAGAAQLERPRGARAAGRRLQGRWRPTGCSAASSRTAPWRGRSCALDRRDEPTAMAEAWAAAVKQRECALVP